jgi:hypothetical protein
MPAVLGPNAASCSPCAIQGSNMQNVASLHRLAMTRDKHCGQQERPDQHRLDHTLSQQFAVEWPAAHAGRGSHNLLLSHTPDAKQTTLGCCMS